MIIRSDQIDMFAVDHGRDGPTYGPTKKKDGVKAIQIQLERDDYTGLKVVLAAGFEPATSSFGGKHSIH